MSCQIHTLGVKLINFFVTYKCVLDKVKGIYCQLNTELKVCAADKETEPENFKLKRSKLYAYKTSAIQIEIGILPFFPFENVDLIKAVRPIDFPLKYTHKTSLCTSLLYTHGGQVCFGFGCRHIAAHLRKFIKSNLLKSVWLGLSLIETLWLRMSTSFSLFIFRLCSSEIVFPFSLSFWSTVEFRWKFNTFVRLFGCAIGIIPGLP